jgi:hypothetical protein
LSRRRRKFNRKRVIKYSHLKMIRKIHLNRKSQKLFKRPPKASEKRKGKRLRSKLIYYRNISRKRRKR